MNFDGQGSAATSSIKGYQCDSLSKFFSSNTESNSSVTPKENVQCTYTSNSTQKARTWDPEGDGEELRELCGLKLQHKNWLLFWV